MENNIESHVDFEKKKRKELEEFKKPRTRRIKVLEPLRPWVSTLAGILGFMLFEGVGYSTLSSGKEPFSVITDWMGGSWTVWLIVISIVVGRLVSVLVSKIFKLSVANLSKAIAEKEKEVSEAISANSRAWSAKKDHEEYQRILAEEEAADLRMSSSELVQEIAMCILPKFKEIISGEIERAHINVNAQLKLQVYSDSIRYGSAEKYPLEEEFVFKEEGITEVLTPILRRALCKALVSELRVLVLEAFPVDPKRKMVQVSLVGDIRMRNHSALEPYKYASDNYAEAVILYRASADKAPKTF